MNTEEKLIIEEITKLQNAVDLFNINFKNLKNKSLSNDNVNRYLNNIIDNVKLLKLDLTNQIEKNETRFEKINIRKNFDKEYLENLPKISMDDQIVIDKLELLNKLNQILPDINKIIPDENIVFTDKILFYYDINNKNIADINSKKIYEDYGSSLKILKMETYDPNGTGPQYKGILIKSTTIYDIIKTIYENLGGLIVYYKFDENKIRFGVTEDTFELKLSEIENLLDLNNYKI